MNMKNTSSEPRVHNRHHNTAPLGAIYVGRGTKWGNPYSLSDGYTRKQAISLFVKLILPTLDCSELRGKHLVCSCVPNDCHANYIFEKANQDEYFE